MIKEQNFFNRPLNLLPHYFKKIGLSLVLLCMLVPIAFKLFYFQIAPIKKEMIKMIVRDIVIIGMFFIVFSREKLEDELTLLLRMKSLASGVVFGIANAITMDVLNICQSEPYKPIDAFGVIFFILFSHIVYYYLAKLKR